MSYIEREKVLEAMQDTKYAKPENDFQRGVNASVDFILADIKHLPTADVVEVRHGEWLQERKLNKRGEYYWTSPQCSVCGENSTFKTKFCQECGAKMDGERSEGYG